MGKQSMNAHNIDDPIFLFSAIFFFFFCSSDNLSLNGLSRIDLADELLYFAKALLDKRQDFFHGGG